MIKINITEKQIKQAENLYDFFDLPKSMMKGKRNIIGALGEIIVRDYFKTHRIKLENTYDYDLIIDGYKVEVKTKKRNNDPKEYYTCSVFAYNLQDCDYYFFVNISSDYKTGWLLGYIKKNDFVEKSKLVKSGEYDGNLKYNEDNYIVKVSDLNKFKEKN